ncbi:MAG: phosphoribosylformylglycinamidine synthase [Phycisphaerales bacterium]|nr:phosphoribosylformylglycinamidine synthase [Phycisphaerales bacterium]
MSTTSTGPLWRIRIHPKRHELDAHAAAVLHDIHELGLSHVSRVVSGRLFLIQGDIAEPDINRVADELLVDPITEVGHITPVSQYTDEPPSQQHAIIEVHLKGGVMDPVAASTLSAIRDMGIDAETLEAATARIYELHDVAAQEELEFIARRLLYNDCIEEVYLSGFGRHDPLPNQLPVAPERPFELRSVAIRDLDDNALTKLSREGHLFLSTEEMRVIRDHYRDLQRDPTDLELETLAQTWSEHCVHKTLKSAVRYRGVPFPACSPITQNKVDPETVEVQYDNLLKETIAQATHELIESGRVDWCLSVFEDNAGVIVLDEQYGLAFKVETHNHPSAIEPYGGAATGIGGVIRDVMGCGLGAKPIANTDVFCVGRPDFPMDLLPKGVLHPRRILKGIVAGVRDYGNRMGIPTLNGAVQFDNRYLGNPLVFCGCLGLIPRRCIEKAPRTGDLIVVIGGRTGRDGIHGATFSSAELTDTHADEFSHAVQIGNAITEKQALDVMMRARDYPDGCLYTATTDCGAGGLSSAIGEMGAKLGATVDLDKVPLKYAGLRYDEIWISEAQERMVLSVPPGNLDIFQKICQAENIEATVLGTFRDDGRLVLRYQGQTVGEINTTFLHDGIPRTRKEAVWQPSAVSAGTQEASENPVERLLGKLAELNTASKEWIIRQYDHEVQGGSVIKPLIGPGQGPSDGAVIRPHLDKPAGVALANGLCSDQAEQDPYWMAVAGIDEAVRNIVCVGGNPDRTAILDNFCWGNCEDPQTMGGLVRSCQGCHDAALAYGTPFISGKDSLNNEFALDPADSQRLAERIRLYNNRIRIPETLLISAISVIDEVSRCITMDAKRPNADPTSFYLVTLQAERWQDVNLVEAAALHRSVAQLIHTGHVLAAHDAGHDGWLTALAEMAFAGCCGIDVALVERGPFAPLTSAYILQVTKPAESALTSLAGNGVVVYRIGVSTSNMKLTMKDDDGNSLEIGIGELDKAWRSSLAW